MSDFPPFFDLGNLSHNQRAKYICMTANANPGKLVGVLIDDTPQRLELYRTLIKRYGPNLRLVDKGQNITKGSRLLQVSTNDQN